LEEKYYSLAEEMYRRLQDIQKEVNVKFIDAGADAERAVKEVNKVLSVRIRECEEGLFNIRLDMRGYSTLTGFPQQSYPPTSPTSATFPTDPEERKSLLSDLRPESESRSNGGYERLDMRLAALERRFEQKKARTQTVNIRNWDDGEVARQEMVELVERKHQEALKDIQTYMESLASSLRQSSPSTPSLSTTAFLYTKDLEPIHTRLSILESILPARQSTAPSTAAPGKEDIQAQIAAIRSSVDAQTKREKVVVELGREVGAVREELMSVESTLVRMRDSLEMMRKEQESGRKRTFPPSIESPVLPSPPQTAVSKQLLVDISSLLASERSRGFSQPPVPLQSSSTEQMQVLESVLGALRHEVERLKVDMTARDKEIDEMNEHFGRMDRMFSGAVQRVQAEVNKKMDSIEELLDRPADDPEASKNLSTLRSVILKLQRDLRSLSGSVRQQTAPLNLEELAPKSKDDTNTLESRLKAMTNYIQRHEQLLKDHDITLHQIIGDMDALNLYLKRSSDTQNIARLNDMERFRGEVETVLRKVMDGVKLNQRDYEKMSELYEQLETKGDKAELSKKVDKVELKRAYAALNRKINSCKEEVRRAVVTPPPPVSPKEEAAVRTRRLDFGCLSCGAEVSSPEPAELSPGLPVSRGLQKYGHGFSKLLPIINDLVSPAHKRGTSEQNQVVTDRGKQQSRKGLDTACSLRLQSDTPPYRIS